MIRLLRRIGTLVAAVTLMGAGLLATTGAAAVAHETPVFPLTGTYVDGTNIAIGITNVGDVIIVNLPGGRPAGHGVVVNAHTIFVDFPDDQSYTGTLVLPGTIRWSNNTSWVKATQIPNVIGQSLTQATQTLQAAGFTSAFAGGVVDCNNLGVVARQTPGAGRWAAPGATVQLRVGTRPAPPRICE